MTDQIRTLTVILDKDYRTDDVETILNAIRMIKGVDHVETCVVTGSDYMNRTIASIELRKIIFEALNKALSI